MVLQFLVTSRARRRLLVLLFGEHQRGSVQELAGLAGVSFAGAHTELKAMQRLQITRSHREGSREVFSANFDHPDADLLSRLAAADVPPRALPTEHDDQIKYALAAWGAPLRGVKAEAKTKARAASARRSDLLQVLCDGVALARRDAVVARSLPLCFWKQRAQIDAKTLSALRMRPEDKHAFAFFLELAGELGGDRRLAGVAETLRDHRLTQCRPFFHASAPGTECDFPLARKWGFSIHMELASFRGLFDKFVRHG